MCGVQARTVVIQCLPRLHWEIKTACNVSEDCPYKVRDTNPGPPSVHSMNANQSAGKICNVALRHALVVVASFSVAASWEGIGTSFRKRGNRTCRSGSKSLAVYRQNWKPVFLVYFWRTYMLLLSYWFVCEKLVYVLFVGYNQRIWHHYNANNS
jgi:hypothetical protein